MSVIDPKEIARRRTFAIISHPDAGKTTLTEKMLLYGGALHLAGAVKARKNQRATASDWMELEKKRGISISSTVLQFDYADHRINLLDTPGHRDFSEDTYRVLTAVDSAIMVIDAAKGIERQTLKLFEVCRKRGIPIFTFMNKLDTPSREPLDLIDELERVLGLAPCPVNWPMGSGSDFRGVFDRFTRQAHHFERTVGGAQRAPVTVRDHSDPTLSDLMEPRLFEQFKEEIAMLDGAGAPFDEAAILRGETTPVFFGSALSNFGVQLLLDGFVRHAPPPGAKRSSAGMVEPTRADFSGFIFKIQGNMDPLHRDRVAFVRVCSGRFERNMQVVHSGTGKTFRLSNSHKIFGREREVVSDAVAGDILGLIGYSDFRIGDTLAENPAVTYREIPRFLPECFAYLTNKNPSQNKAYRKGLDHFIMEGIVQPFHLRDAGSATTLLAAVGPLQFEVLQYRLATEYGAESILENAPFETVRWMDPADVAHLTREGAPLLFGARLGKDAADRPVIVFTSEWHLDYFRGKNEGVKLYDAVPDDSPAAAAIDAAEADEADGLAHPERILRG